MNYIIMDMEWNQAVSAAKMVRSPVLLHGEIIQIGAFKVNDKFELIDKIKINVRPKYYKKINSHVEKLTGITQTQLTAGEIFPQAFRRFKQWCGAEFRFITWGFDDLGVLADNLTLHGLDPSFGSDYINLQLIYNRQMKDEHLQCALSTAAEKLEIPLDVQVHDAFNDAYLTYEVCKKLDMTLGIAEYAEYAAAVPTPVFKDAVNNVSDVKKMLFDRRVMELFCPTCGKGLKYRQWLFTNAKSCKTIAVCNACGGLFSVKFKASMISEGDHTVVRTVYAASDEDAAAFEEKLRKREERRRKAAQARREQMDKAEEKNEENGDV